MHPGSQRLERRLKAFCQLQTSMEARASASGRPLLGTRRCCTCMNQTLVFASAQPAHLDTLPAGTAAHTGRAGLTIEQRIVRVVWVERQQALAHVHQALQGQPGGQRAVGHTIRVAAARRRRPRAWAWWVLARRPDASVPTLYNPVLLLCVWVPGVWAGQPTCATRTRKSSVGSL